MDLLKDDIKKKEYKINSNYAPSIDMTLSKGANFLPNDANFIIIPAFMDSNGTYKVAKHMGYKGAENKEGVATTLIIYNLKQKEETSWNLVDMNIITSDTPGMDLYKAIKNYERFTKVILVTDRKLKIGEMEESELENIIINITAKEGDDVKEIIEEVQKKIGGKESKEETYEGKEENEDEIAEKESDAAEESADSEGGEQ